MNSFPGACAAKPWFAALAMIVVTCVSASAADETLGASKAAAAIDAQLDWSRAGLIVVQDAGRYKTFDSFSREALAAMYGEEQFPALSPCASALDWMFHREAYADTPVIRIKDKGLRIDFSTHLTDDRRERVRSVGRMTPREFFSPQVAHVIDELEPKSAMKSAIGRVRDAQVVAEALDRMLRIVPQPGASADARWNTPDEIRGNLAPEVLRRIGIPESVAGRPVPGISPEQALAVLLPWSRLKEAWRTGDADGVQRSLDQLAAVLPTLAADGVYPGESQRRAEARYYQLGKFTGGWMLYFAGVIVGIWAVVTRWRLPFVLGMLLLLGAMTFHAYGVGLRWYILGRIPIANMFEAVIGSACLGVAVGFVLELRYRARVFLLASHALGFLALILGGYVIPGGGNLTTIMGILDDVMLRIHTLLIIWSYALIFIGAVIAIVYLVGYYASRVSPASGGALPPVPLGASFAGGRSRPVLPDRPILAGALPVDSPNDARLPQWLHQVDWCHLIILNLVFVMLFVGTVLGAVWADYSWGRPWGWDPKEVFALNTWLIYAILIHTRFFVARKGYWTAWLSIGGCLMMAFNWCFVNFFIVGLHSYA